MAVDGRKHDRIRFTIGQLVLVRPIHTFVCAELWPGPPHLFDTSLPVRQINKDTICLVLDIYITSCKVVVDGQVGWVDNHELLPL